MKIRKYVEADKQNIIELLRLNTPKYFAPEEEQDLILYLQNHSENYFVIETGDAIIGSGGFNVQENIDVVRISWDIIHPQFHKKGIGTELIKFRIQQIKNMDDVKIICVRTSQLAYQFYERFEFELKEIVKDYWAPGFDMYIMEMNIKQ